MRTLNLANPEKTEILYEHSKYPDGQQSIRITDTLNMVGDGYSLPVKISSRLNNFLDLEAIICANQSLRETGFKEVHIYIPYFLGARSDRKFMEGSCNYLKTVICPIINVQNFASVTVIDPHSNVLEMGLNNFRKIDNTVLVRWALEQIDNRNDAQERIVLVSPDSGSLEKIYHVAKIFRLEKVIVASKHRDIHSGKILGTFVPSLKEQNCAEPEQQYVIIDDICDGGRTFIELAKAIRLQRADAKIYLIVTHGIFSAGFGELNNHFEKIFCTDSVKIVNNSQVQQLSIF